MVWKKYRENKNHEKMKESRNLSKLKKNAHIDYPVDEHVLYASLEKD